MLVCQLSCGRFKFDARPLNGGLQMMDSEVTVAVQVSLLHHAYLATGYSDPVSFGSLRFTPQKTVHDSKVNK